MRKLIHLVFKFNKWLGRFAGLLILIASILISFDVFMRYFIGKPTLWIYDVSRYSLLCIVFFSVAAALQEKAHINMDFLLERVSKSMRKILIIISDFCVLIFSCFVFWFSFQALMRAIERGSGTFGTIIIPTSWLYFIILLGVVLLIVTSLFLIVVHSKDSEEERKIERNPATRGGTEWKL